MFNDWTPVPTLNEHAGIEKSGPQDFPPYQLFDIDGNVILVYFILSSEIKAYQKQKKCDISH